jgi:hypothetical protein
MERDLNSSHVEERSEHVSNVANGGQVTNSDLLKAGVEEVREDNVANVDLVRTSRSPLVRLLIVFRLPHWGQTNQIHGERATESYTPCVSWYICARQ